MAFVVCQEMLALKRCCESFFAGCERAPFNARMCLLHVAGESGQLTKIATALVL